MLYTEIFQRSGLNNTTCAARCETNECVAPGFDTYFYRALHPYRSICFQRLLVHHVRGGLVGLGVGLGVGLSQYAGLHVHVQQHFGSFIPNPGPHIPALIQSPD